MSDPLWFSPTRNLSLDEILHRVAKLHVPILCRFCVAQLAKLDLDRHQLLPEYRSHGVDVQSSCSFEVIRSLNV